MKEKVIKSYHTKSETNLFVNKWPYPKVERNHKKDILPNQS
jgi:hypothetical protein